MTYSPERFLSRTLQLSLMLLLMAANAAAQDATPSINSPVTDLADALLEPRRDLVGLKAQQRKHADEHERHRRRARSGDKGEFRPLEPR